MSVGLGSGWGWILSTIKLLPRRALMKWSSQNLSFRFWCSCLKCWASFGQSVDVLRSKPLPDLESHLIQRCKFHPPVAVLGAVFSLIFHITMLFSFIMCKRQWPFHVPHFSQAYEWKVSFNYFFLFIIFPLHEWMMKACCVTNSKAMKQWGGISMSIHSDEKNKLFHIHFPFFLWRIMLSYCACKCVRARTSSRTWMDEAKSA